ncbi:major facilitator superfamily domain-containing protein [Aspergillus pseudocaelatus]|uniref:Major facilitator superfamily domain-containing protein n=1 Tax=Aspergillus pseudocaelatus TaxID=1825620 RepID=A0ABQ6WBG7_9EURO|nr:major facilitator superfamily domain-containing protein [Aspergillus pseudocaelatus]
MDEKEKYHQAAENADLERDSENLHGRDIDNPRERALVWKQDLRILPLCAAIYLLCYLDRSNIGRLQVLQLFTLSLMVFLIAYALFEVPSNYFLKKLRPSKWIAFLMLGWGASTMGLGGAHNYAQVTGIRFLLGVMEAGLFPGLVYYLTFWYRNSERSMRVALILASATLAGAFGGAIAYGVGHMNQTHGLSAWRWLFIIEGAPSCASAFLVWFFLPDYPETASWLSAEEKELAMQRLQNEGSKGAAHAMTWADAKEVLTDWRLYAHYMVRLSLIYFGISTPFSSLSLFTPAITSGLGYTSLRAQLMTVPPWAVAYVVTTAAAWSADHFNSRGLHSAAFSFIGAMGFLASAVLPPDAYLHRYGCLIVATSGAFACIPPLLGWLSSNLRSTAGTGLAIALNVSVGAPGQIVGVWIYKANEAKRGYPTGHWTNAALLLFVCVGCLLLRVYYGWRNKRRGTGDKFAY